jgi:RNA polymerase sigma factor (TIGR02999 family)
MYMNYTATQDTPITLFLQESAPGDRNVLDRLVAILYPELRRLARKYLRNERAGHTLQSTGLVHEAYARLSEQDHRTYRNRAHFMSVASYLMRQILVDHARVRNAQKRGRDVAKTPLDEATVLSTEKPDMILAVDDALMELKRKDDVKARLIEMRFFGGMTAEDSAEALEMPVERVRRHLRVAQAWLKQRLGDSM